MNDSNACMEGSGSGRVGRREDALRHCAADEPQVAQQQPRGKGQLGAVKPDARAQLCERRVSAAPTPLQCRRRTAPACRPLRWLRSVRQRRRVVATVGEGLEEQRHPARRQMSSCAAVVRPPSAASMRRVSERCCMAGCARGGRGGAAASTATPDDDDGATINAVLAAEAGARSASRSSCKSTIASDKRDPLQAGLSWRSPPRPPAGPSASGECSGMPTRCVCKVREKKRVPERRVGTASPLLPGACWGKGAAAMAAACTILTLDPCMFL